MGSLPSFVAVVFDAELCATCDDAAVCRLEKFLFQPCPLFFTKHGLAGILGGQVVERVEKAFVFSALGISWDRVPKAPSIQEDDLHGFFPDLAGHRMIDALVLVAWRVLGLFKKLEEDLLGCFFVRVFVSGVISAVVMIVPGGKNLGVFFQVLKRGLIG